MKVLKRGISILCVVAMAGGFFMQSTVGMAAAKKVKLNKAKISLKEGASYKIKLKNGNKRAKVTWESDKKKVVKITKKSAKGKTAYAKVKALRTGKAKVRAVYKEGRKVKKLSCIVTVKKKTGASNVKKEPEPVIPSNNMTPAASPDSHTPGEAPSNPQTGPVTLFNREMVAPVIMDSSYEVSDQNPYAERSYRQIKRAVTDLRQDIAMVTGAVDDEEIQAMFEDNMEEENRRLDEADASKVPAFVTDVEKVNADCAIIAGTVDDSAVIKKIMDSGKLEEAKSLKGVWEGYVIKQVKNPVDGVGNALVIAGSDARGTIYGIYTVSEAIGVSPFYWYSDVPVEVKDEIQFDAAVPIVNDGPDVKYRGIFINDEEKSNDWAEKKFTGDGKNGPGVNYYRRVFELMLRMKANTLWPAMHNCSVAFNKVVDEDGNPVNAKEAAEYGIIMSASHCEILLRNNVGEWGDWFTKNKGRFSDVKYPNNSGKAYDFTLNRELLLEYWRERLTANKDFESILTVGIRGPHDEAVSLRRPQHVRRK